MNSASRKPKEGWQQQNCASFMFIPSRNFALCLYIFIAVTNLVFGGILFMYSMEVKEYKTEYSCNAKSCEVAVDVQEKMNKPVYLYYELENYYQNHRIYMKSRCPNQLAAKSISSSELSECEPVTKVKDLEGVSGIDTNAVANPCGLVAKSYFKDRFQFTNGITIKETGIAWPSDLDGKFKNLPDWQKKQWQDVEDEHFIVWMRIAATSNFRKLWGVIDQDLEKNMYKIKVEEHMDYEAFNGKKSIVLATANRFGGKNLVLSYAFFISGGLASIWTVVFIFYPCLIKRK